MPTRPYIPGSRVNGVLIIASLGIGPDRHGRYLMKCPSCDEQFQRSSKNMRKITSCGCECPSNPRYKDKSGLRTLYWETQNRHLTEGWKGECISYEQYKDLVRENCVYCDAPPSNTSATGRKYQGLDRSDNNKGYTIENAVPCCKRCNWAKGTGTRAEMVAHARRIVHIADE